MTASGLQTDLNDENELRKIVKDKHFLNNIFF